jgi:hypothetical protein
METLKANQICSFLHDSKDMACVKSAGLPVSSKPGHEVTSYEELLEKVASLNYYNPSLKLFFRGQRKDYFNYTSDGRPVRSSLYPSILRRLPANKNKRSKVIRERLSLLRQADSAFQEEIRVGYIHRHMLVRWAILQHYEVCLTPLLDLTDSLQVALSFAASAESQNGYLYVFGLPYQTSPISVSVESMTQVVDLSKLCPPEVSRPHFQSAYLAADYPTAVYPEDLIQRAPRVEANFACRLLTKFQLNGLQSWSKTQFNPVSQDILFPNQRDQWYTILADIKTKITQQTKSADPKNAARSSGG